jgi:Zn-dependent protease with chaperone function
MRLVISTVIVTLAWFAIVNIAVSAAVWLLARRTAIGPSWGAERLLTLRLLPTVLSLIVVASVIVPGHLLHEPAEPDEVFGIGLWTLVALTAALLVRSGRRLVSVARASALLSRWALAAQHREGDEALEINGLNGVSLAGVFRTRVLIGSTARAALNDAELEVAVAHELAHRSSWDNLKRCVMFCAPDLFGVTVAARNLEARWRAAAECRADALAVRGDEMRATHLASALVKVARLGQPSAPSYASPIWSTFHETPLLETRVRRLVAVPETLGHEPSTLSLYLTVVAVLPLAVWLGGLPYQLHLLTELLIASMP